MYTFIVRLKKTRDLFNPLDCFLESMMKKMISASILATATLMMSAGASAQSLNDNVPNLEQQARIDSAKAKILEIVSGNVERIDNFPEVRAELTPFVNVLSEFAPTAEDSLNEKIGSWQQLWTDDADDLRANNAFQSTDRTRTFQVVFDNGVFYNLTEVKTLFGRFAGFLRGVYEQEGSVLSLEFTKIRLKRGNLGPMEDLGNLTKLFEEGKIEGTFKIPFGSDRYPDGPVGATGTIKTVYIDDELRIDIGSNDADGVEDLFVLKRIVN